MNMEPDYVKLTALSILVSGGGLPDYYLVIQRMDKGVFIKKVIRHKEFRRPVTHIPNGLLDGRKLRRDDRGQSRVVKPAYRKIFWQGQAFAICNGDYARGHIIIAGKNGARAVWQA